MINQLEISDVAKETICVLDYFNPELVSKIPTNVINKLKGLAKESDKTINIEINKKLKKQCISEETKDLISLIYYSYIATEEQRKELTEIWDKNELMYQEDIKKKYDIDNIFNRKISKEKNELITIEKEKNIFQKVLDKIKAVLEKK